MDSFINSWRIQMKMCVCVAHRHAHLEKIQSLWIANVPEISTRIQYLAFPIHI